MDSKRKLHYLCFDQLVNITSVKAYKQVLNARLSKCLDYKLTPQMSVNWLKDFYLWEFARQCACAYILRENMSAAAVLTQWGGWNSPVIHQEVFILGRSRMPDCQSKLSPSIPLYWLTPSGRKVEKPAAQCDLKKCIDILSRLPPELRAIILSYLNARDLCRY